MLDLVGGAQVLEFLGSEFGLLVLGETGLLGLLLYLLEEVLQQLLLLFIDEILLLSEGGVLLALARAGRGGESG